MMQIDMKAVTNLLAERGIEIGEHPDLIVQIMAVNERLAATPSFTIEVMEAMTAALLRSPKDDEHT